MKNIKEQIDKLQEEFFNNFGDKNPYYLKYTQVGFVEAVDLEVSLSDNLIEISLWNSESEERIFIEGFNDYEDFNIFLKRKVKECVKSLKKLKLSL